MPHSNFEKDDGPVTGLRDLMEQPGVISRAPLIKTFKASGAAVHGGNGGSGRLRVVFGDSVMEVPRQVQVGPDTNVARFAAQILDNSPKPAA